MANTLLAVEQVARKITPRTRAIVPVHIYGHPTDMEPLMALADEHARMSVGKLLPLLIFADLLTLA